MKRIAGVALTAGVLCLWAWGYSRPPAVVFTVSTQACARPVSGTSLAELGVLLKQRGQKVLSVDAAANCVHVEYVLEKRSIGEFEGVERP